MMASYQQRTIAYYNRNARPCAFRIETLVLRRVFENMTKKGAGKLQAIRKDLTLYLRSWT